MEGESYKVIYTIIIPVYNRPYELEALLETLKEQTYTHFEVIVVEDGSTMDSECVINIFKNSLKLFYYRLSENRGASFARNYAAQKANGTYLIFLDSDTLLPEQYMEQWCRAVQQKRVSAYGGPDTQHHSFTKVQKAINYAMTSFFTTGGVRGAKHTLEGRFQLRSFNMMVTKKAFNSVGGFKNLRYGEDPDFCFSLWSSGFTSIFWPHAFVYHKRRINLLDFFKQLYRFGVARPILNKRHPAYRHWVFILPSLFLLGILAVLLLSYFHSILLLLPLNYISILFFDAFFKQRNLKTALLSVWASLIQITAYGIGFLHAYFKIFILKQEPKDAFPNFFIEKL